VTYSLPRLVTLATLALGACVPPQGAASNTAAAGSGADSSCETACTRAIACQLVADDGTCPDQCRAQGYDAATLAQINRSACPEIADIVQRHGQTASAGDDQPTSSGGGGNHLCTAHGTYTSCADGGCADADASATGLGRNTSDARTMAIAKCNGMIHGAIVLAPSGTHVSIKDPCAATSCS
jgi:hypothetical protein